MGGAIFNYGGILNITDSTFTGNSALLGIGATGGTGTTAANGQGFGGAIFTLNGTVSLVTLGGNSASTLGSDIYAYGNSYGSADGFNGPTSTAAVIYYANTTWTQTDNGGDVTYLELEEPPAAVPEPSSIAIAVCGLAGLLGLAWAARRKKG